MPAAIPQVPHVSGHPDIRAGGPIAIVGVGCRFPGGVEDAQSYWRFLRQGGDAVGPIPVARWSQADPGGASGAGQAYSRDMGALRDIDRFDASFFGISRREAASMDPQHRLLMEVAWQAVENAAWAPPSLAGTRTGVFVGIYSDDYSQERLYRRPAAEIDGHAGLGLMRSLAAGRIAYHLDLHGPVITLDTACSSSLLAVHLACRSLRDGDCDRALAGGVNLVLAPEITLALCRMQALSRSGRCRTFSADADGFVRGEGCGVVALRRLSDALASGDPVIAVILGSAVNHDGRSNGISAPNGVAQRDVIRAALADAGVGGRSIGYVEAHGTGTALGDPIELRALGDAYGTDREQPLLVGSAKTNFGHLEAAAGIAGLIKAALAAHHGEVPANLHFRTPNPLIPWDRINMAVAVEPVPWTGPDPRRAAVSAFGMSGTNVHMILEAPPLRVVTASAPRTEVLTLSAHTASALAAAAHRLADALAAAPAVDGAAVALTMNGGRARLGERAAFVFETVPALIAQLRDFTPPATTGVRSRSVAFRFSSSRPLPDAADDAVAAMAPGLAQLEEGLAAAGPDIAVTLAGDPAFAIFRTAYAAATAFRRWGVVPDQLIGHGLGEIVAACQAGVFSLEDALRLLAARSQVLALADGESGRFAFLRTVRGLTLSPPNRPLVSSLLGRAAGAEVTSPAFWWELVIRDDTPAALPVGEDIIVLDVVALAGSRTDRCRCWADLHLAGLAPDWTSIDDQRQPPRIALPGYPFEGERHFIERPRGLAVAEASPGGLAGRPLPLAATDERRFGLTIGGRAHAFLQDHRVSGQAILPMTALVEIAIQNARAAGRGAIEQLLAVRPLRLPADGTVEVQTVVAPDGAWRLYAQTENAGSDAAWTLYATARLTDTVGAGASDAEPLAEGPAALETIPGSDIYADLAVHGVEARPAFRSLLTVERSGLLATARVQLPDCAGAADPFAIHPALLDGCLVAASCILPSLPAEETWLPTGIDRVVVQAAGATSARTVLRLRGAATAQRCQIDVRLMEGDQVLAILDGVTFRSIRQADHLAAASSGPMPIRRIVWRPDVVEDMHVQPQRILLIGDDEAVASAARTELMERGHGVSLAPFDVSGDAPALARWLAASRPAVGACTIVDLALQAADCAAGVPRSYRRHLGLVQAVGRIADRRDLRIALVTRGSQRVTTEDVTAVAEAGLWGLSRVAAAEYPDLRLIRIDLDARGGLSNVDLARELAPLLLRGAGATEVAVRNGQVFAATASEREAPVRTVVRPRFDGGAPGTGEVVVTPVASGLNFRDVLHGMGLLPTSAEHMPYGLECAGIVTAVGAGVQGLRPGMPIIAGLTVGSLADRVRVPAAFVVAKPDHLSFRDAATLPLAFLTAHYGLDRLAKLKRGERVLIHAAAGGVGQAAIQVARRAGAEIFATASPGKWARLRRQGIDHVYNSRSLAFADEIRRATGGRGVDVVLNSLSGDAIGASFAALADGGRFVEIGKLDVWTAEQVTALGRNIAYHPFDLWDVKQDHALVADMMGELLARLEDGTLRPLPAEVFSIDDAAAAFQHMARAHHIGKIVLWQAPPGQGGLVGPRGTYLVTGGLGALGLHAAHWLVSRGARRIVLAGRSEPTATARGAIDHLRAAGADVRVVPCDVSIPGDVARLLAACADLTGIIHAAGVLDDALIVHQDEARMGRALAPKLTGGWLLHEAVGDRPLDFFLLYASAAGVVGLPGQANYAAANAALDALADHRAALGLPGLAVDWGPWAGAGMAETIDRSSIACIEPAAAEAILDRLLLERPGRVVVAAAQLLSAPADAPRTIAQGPAAPRPALLDELDRSSPADRVRLLRNHVTQLVAASLELPRTHAVDPSRPLEELGFDSLMNLELKASLDKDLGVTLRPTLAYDFPSIDALVAHLADDAVQWASLPPAPRSVGSSGPSPLEDELLAELRALNY
ncbi:type I polyketide synthase [Chelatococcus reniformis]|uniref:Polyketide synthase n=1 Tax=Chelatococcus reniformis TaxID=1494448 RepID=A0A916TYC7_9HYPH|nr:SDR family NAD(P)-dependent oxidoreductase [Chelatococcus reniformis]GGC48562.1 hypothetical protein GCM10010994_04680 [Chelatococcus reniformis]